MAKLCIRMKVPKINWEVDSVQKIKREVECWVIGGIGEYEEELWSHSAIVRIYIAKIL
jgi:hypothetical protein